MVMGRKLKQVNYVKRLENRQLKILNDGLSRFFSASGKRSSSMRSYSCRQHENNAVSSENGNGEKLANNGPLKKRFDGFCENLDTVKSASSNGKQAQLNAVRTHGSLRNERSEHCGTNYTSSGNGGRCKNSKFSVTLKRHSRKRSQVEALCDGLTPIYAVHNSARQRFHAFATSKLQVNKPYMSSISKVRATRHPKEIAKIKKIKDSHNSETFVCFPSLNQNRSKNLQLKRLCDGLSHKYNVIGERVRKSLHFYTYPPARSQRCVQSVIKDELLNMRRSQKSSQCEELLDTCEVNHSTSKPTILSKLLSAGSVNGSQNDFQKYKVSPKWQLPSVQSYKDGRIGHGLRRVIAEEDRKLFCQARELSEQQLSTCSRPTSYTDVPAHCAPSCIEIGIYELSTWYSSPYPPQYARASKLFICELCLKYFRSRTALASHGEKCRMFAPPGNEIYRDGLLSVFEVDGDINRLYCRNLCLLAKLFLDHKTLYYDVEPFLFYVLTHTDNSGSHIIGYFSKEKLCQLKYNLSCIMILPQYQRQGYGGFLIDFSYWLSRLEGHPGSPEKPLSDLGLVSYRAYWKASFLHFLQRRRNSCLTIEDITLHTGITEDDLISTLYFLDLLVEEDTSFSAVEVKCNLLRQSSKRRDKLQLHIHLLNWSPHDGNNSVVNRPSLLEI